jgi:hypothetical protein
MRADEKRVVSTYFITERLFIVSWVGTHYPFFLNPKDRKRSTSLSIPTNRQTFLDLGSIQLRKEINYFLLEHTKHETPSKTHKKKSNKKLAKLKQQTTNNNSKANMMRSLYDEEFLEAGCPTEQYDEVYKIDDTIGTYITNFCILAVCLVAVIKLSLSTKQQTSNIFMIAFFAFNGLSFGIAGVYHAVVSRRDDPSTYPFTRAIYLPYGISTTCFSLAVLGLVTDNAVAWWAVSITTTAITLYSRIIIDHVIAGVLMHLFLVLPLACVVYGIQIRRHNKHKCNNIAKGFGVILMWFGLIVQLLLRGKCGDGGYEDCFEECPLPNPSKFNHNALFHLLHMFGVLLLAVAEDMHPSLPAEKGEDNEPEQGQRQKILSEGGNHMFYS